MTPNDQKRFKRSYSDDDEDYESSDNVESSNCDMSYKESDEECQHFSLG